MAGFPPRSIRWRGRPLLRVSGEILQINQELAREPALRNLALAVGVGLLQARQKDGFDPSLEELWQFAALYCLPEARFRPAAHLPDAELAAQFEVPVELVRLRRAMPPDPPG